MFDVHFFLPSYKNNLALMGIIPAPTFSEQAPYPDKPELNIDE